MFVRGFPSSTSPGDSASTAVPDSDYITSDGCLSTEVAEIARVLRDFELLNDLSQGGTISGSVLSGDAYFLGLLGHGLEKIKLKSLFKKVTNNYEREISHYTNSVMLIVPFQSFTILP
jgi:hypothetical protein